MRAFSSLLMSWILLKDISFSAALHFDIFLAFKAYDGLLPLFGPGRRSPCPPIHPDKCLAQNGDRSHGSGFCDPKLHGPARSAYLCLPGVYGCLFLHPQGRHVGVLLFDHHEDAILRPIHAQLASILHPGVPDIPDDMGVVCEITTPVPVQKARFDGYAELGFLLSCCPPFCNSDKDFCEVHLARIITRRITVVRIPHEASFSEPSPSESGVKNR